MGSSSFETTGYNNVTNAFNGISVEELLLVNHQVYQPVRTLHLELHFG
jgi:hypothetical protein